MKNKFSTPFLYPNRIWDKTGNDRLRIASAVIAQEAARKNSISQTVELIRGILKDIASARRDAKNHVRLSMSY